MWEATEDNTYVHTGTHTCTRGHIPPHKLKKEKKTEEGWEEWKEKCLLSPCQVTVESTEAIRPCQKLLCAGITCLPFLEDVRPGIRLHAVLVQTCQKQLKLFYRKRP